MGCIPKMIGKRVNSRLASAVALSRNRTLVAPVASQCLNLQTTDPWQQVKQGRQGCFNVHQTLSNIVKHCQTLSNIVKQRQTAVFYRSVCLHSISIPSHSIPFHLHLSRYDFFFVHRVTVRHRWCSGQSLCLLPRRPRFNSQRRHVKFRFF